MAATDSSVKSKPSLLKKTSFKPTWSNPVQPTIPSQRRILLETTTLYDSDRSYVPPAGTKMPDPNDSRIAKRLTRLGSKVDTPKSTNQSTNSSSTDYPFSESEYEKESNPLYSENRTAYFQIELLF